MKISMKEEKRLRNSKHVELYLQKKRKKRKFLTGFLAEVSVFNNSWTEIDHWHIFNERKRNTDHEGSQSERILGLFLSRRRRGEQTDECK